MHCIYDKYRMFWLLISVICYVNLTASLQADTIGLSNNFEKNIFKSILKILHILEVIQYILLSPNCG